MTWPVALENVLSREHDSSDECIDRALTVIHAWLDLLPSKMDSHASSDECIDWALTVIHAWPDLPGQPGTILGFSSSWRQQAQSCLFSPFLFFFCTNEPVALEDGFSREHDSSDGCNDRALVHALTVIHAWPDLLPWKMDSAESMAATVVAWERQPSWVAAMRARARLGSRGRLTIWRPRGVMPPSMSSASSTHSCFRAFSRASLCKNAREFVLSCAVANQTAWRKIIMILSGK